MSSLEQGVNQEVYYGILPMMPKERIYDFKATVLIIGGYAIATWCYVQGGYIGTMLPLKALFSSTVFSMTLVGLLVCLVGIIPQRHGIDMWLYQRAIFGYSLIGIIWLIVIASTWGYEAVNARLFANSIMTVLQELGIPAEGPVWVGVLGTACIVIGGVIAVKGPVAIKISTYIMVPCLLAVGVLIVVLIFRNASWADLMAVNPAESLGGDDFRTNYMVVLEWNIAFIFAWYPGFAVLPRLVKTEKSYYWGFLLGFCTIMACFVLIGAMTGLLTYAKTGVASTDPTDWLIGLGGPVLGLLSLVFIGFANITTQALACYTIGMSTKTMLPRRSYKSIVVFWSIFCIVLVFWDGIWQYYNTYIAIVGAVSGPAIMLLIVDYFIVRKGKFSLTGVYRLNGDCRYRYTKGFNIPALVSFAIGVTVYFVVYDPVAAWPRSDLFLYTTASGFSAICTTASYYIMSKIPAVRKYMQV
ncbi:MAG: cytosine permease [Clostridiales Family XIII bacterium]|jgi:NCS1 family nucleobase:cation symporter-1|nr:cytosine permease [Clostridiales Family XIII bacterium]